MATKTNNDTVRISVFCNAAQHSDCTVPDAHCKCNCHDNVQTFMENSTLKDIIIRIAYDFWMTSRYREVSTVLIRNVLMGNLSKMGYEIVPSDTPITSDKALHLSDIYTVIAIIEVLNKRDDWSMWRIERLLESEDTDILL